MWIICQETAFLFFVKYCWITKFFVVKCLWNFFLLFIKGKVIIVFIISSYGIIYKIKNISFSWFINLQGFGSGRWIALNLWFCYSWDSGLQYFFSVLFIISSHSCLRRLIPILTLQNVIPIVLTKCMNCR